MVIRETFNERVKSEQRCNGKRERTSGWVVGGTESSVTSLSQWRTTFCKLFKLPGPWPPHLSSRSKNTPDKFVGDFEDQVWRIYACTSPINPVGRGPGSLVLGLWLTGVQTGGIHSCKWKHKESSFAQLLYSKSSLSAIHKLGPHFPEQRHLHITSPHWPPIWHASYTSSLSQSHLHAQIFNICSPLTSPYHLLPRQWSFPRVRPLLLSSGRECSLNPVAFAKSTYPPHFHSFEAVQCVASVCFVEPGATV